ncbi:hypothetical protein [Gloeobacter morelensis]|nr:hypothetical protein [Gloeobacter morelensis]
MRYPTEQVHRAAVLSLLCALAMILHVLSWIVLGVVMAPTYILLVLAGICLGLNVWAVSYPANLQRRLAWIGGWGKLSATVR